VATRRPTLRAELAAAADRLRAVDSPDLAAAVDTVLAPNGWAALRATDTTADEGMGPSMSILIDKALKEEIEARAKSVGNVLNHDVNEGLARYLAGSFTPRPQGKARWGTGSENVTLSVRPKKSLRDQVKARGEKPSTLAKEYLLFKYEVGHYAPGHAGEEQRPRGAVRNPQMPRDLRDRVRAAQQAAGNTVTDDVEEGLAAYLDGTFTPEAPVWTAEQLGDMVNIKMNPNDDLYEQATTKGKDAKLRPAQVALAYLLHKYGIGPAS